MLSQNVMVAPDETGWPCPLRLRSKPE